MPQVLLCPPDYYGIRYEINPWMDRTRNADQELAASQWRLLRDRLQALGCDVQQIAPQPDVPDMVFTANAGLVLGRRFLRANFRYPQRQREAAYFEQRFADGGYEVVRLPEDLFFEGEGDGLFCGDVLFCGYRFRSDIRAHRWIGDFLKCLVISVELVNARFYHLDTCFCPLPDGSAIWFPPAFDDYGQRAIGQHIHDLIEVTPGEAARFACNAVVIGHDVILADGCPELGADLRQRGYRCHELAMSEFIKAGGACKCLTLRLPQRP
jgi:N-dimethylarginine dimethylaminohydrolase